MNATEKIAAMAQIFLKALCLAKAKSHDYSGDIDSMSNFRMFGWKGIVVRLNDKMMRVVNYAKSGIHKVKEENLENDMIDIINYAALTLIMYLEENSPGEQSTTKAPVDYRVVLASLAEANKGLRNEDINRVFARADYGKIRVG